MSLLHASFTSLRLFLSLDHPMKVTATECTERAGHNEVGMDNVASRGSRHVADEGRAAPSDEAPSGSDNVSPSPDAATPTAATTPRATPREEGEEEEGDAAAKRGDVEFCKRKEVRYHDETHQATCNLPW